MRSQLAQRVSGLGLVRATMNWREKTFGKPNCRRHHGEQHRGRYMLVNEDGKVQQLFTSRPPNDDGDRIPNDQLSTKPGQVQPSEESEQKQRVLSRRPVEDSSLNHGAWMLHGAPQRRGEDYHEEA